MKRLLILALFLVGLTGCGPDKRSVAESKLNQQADTWDGGPNFTPEGTDPWGQPYTAKVEKGDTHYYLTVRSSGPDKLPQTRDDVVATRSHKHTNYSDAAAGGVEKLSEALGKGLGRGGVAGVREGITGKKPEDKKGEEKKPHEKKDEAKKN
jgi:hypothetical protein